MEAARRKFAIGNVRDHAIALVRMGNGSQEPEPVHFGNRCLTVSRDAVGRIPFAFQTNKGLQASRQKRPKTAET